MNDRQSGFWPMLAGLVLGAGAGATAMFFMSPRSGKANRRIVRHKWEELSDYVHEEKEAVTERVYEIFGEVNAMTLALYKDARRMWDAQVRSFEKSLSKIDKKGYQEMVDDIIEKLQATKKYADDDLSKVKRYLNSQWRKLLAAAE